MEGPGGWFDSPKGSKVPTAVDDKYSALFISSTVWVPLWVPENGYLGSTCGPKDLPL